MAYVPGYKYDLFLSYPRENREWVRQFRRQLEEVLNEKSSNDPKPKIFFDDSDWGGQNSAKLLEAARHSALFVAIVLPAYVTPNKFTLKELEAFCNAQKVRGLDDPHIFVVEYLPIDGRNRPAELKSPRRYQFWAKKNDTDVPLNVGEESKTESHRLATHILNRLDEMTAGSANSPTPITSYLGKKALLGHVTDELLGTREDLCEHLRGLGVTVLPDNEFPEWGSEFRVFFESQIAQLGSSDLFIQLLGAVRSSKVPTEQESSAQFQNRVAREAGKRVILWRSDVLKMADVPQHHDRALLESAQAMSFEQLKGAITEALDQSIKKELETSIAASKPATVPFVYIAASNDDLGMAFKLQETAVENKGEARIMDDENPFRDLEEQIEHAAAIVFIHGMASRSFVDGWLSRYLRLKREQPRARIEMLYKAPPSKTNLIDRLRTDWGGLRKCGSYEEEYRADCMHNLLSELTGANIECPRCGKGRSGR